MKCYFFLGIHFDQIAIIAYDQILLNIILQAMHRYRIDQPFIKCYVDNESYSFKVTVYRITILH